MTTKTLVRPIFFRALIFTAFAAMLALMFGCVGPQVRDSTLLPLANNAFPRVRDDIMRGVEASLEAGAMNQAVATELELDVAELGLALSAGDRARLKLVQWAPLEAMAVVGIQDRIADGELSEANATLFYQRLVNFRDVLDRLSERVAGTSFIRNKGRSVTVTTGSGSFNLYSGYIPGDWDSDDPTWSTYYYHNRPRAALGLPLITSGDLPFRPSSSVVDLLD